MIVEALRINPASGATPKQSDVAPAPAAGEAIEAAAAQARVGGEGLRQLVAAANRATKSLNNSVQLSLDSQSGKPVVRVVDSETGQLIRQIPSEEIMELRRALDRIAAGLLIHRTA